LPVRQRTAVALRHIGDLTEKEIARAMGITRSTVSSTLADAHRTLADALAEEDVHDA
jgi:RNA polymerase sigma factor (sigma-70 family)